MLIRDSVKIVGERTLRPCGCDSPAVIEMHGYIGDGGPDDSGTPFNLYADCALPLTRKLLGNLCELHTHGGRHG